MAANLFRRAMDHVKARLGMPVPKRGEILNDRFSDALVRHAADPEIRTILEIGSSTGEGSTQALIRGMQANPSRPRLFCLEALTDRFEALQERCRSMPNVSCYNASSVSLHEVESEELVARFGATCPRAAPVQKQLAWRASELGYIQENKITTGGIELIKSEAGIALFDLVLIDGSEFAGRAELDAVYGARVIALDDILVLKNHYNLVRLTYDTDYELVESDISLRNGFAIFRRRG